TIWTFRDQMIAAPLKPCRTAPICAGSPTFRDQMIAAPLKHWRRVGATHESSTFRDQMIAAPLKLSHSPNARRYVARLGPLPAKTQPLVLYVPFRSQMLRKDVHFFKNFRCQFCHHNAIV